MPTALKSLGHWSYNSVPDASRYYNRDKNAVKNEYFNVEIEENNKGVNYIHININSSDERVHVFIAKGLLSSIKYAILKYFSKDWTEVELCKQDGNYSKKITLLIDNKNLILNRESTQCIASVFGFALRPKIKDIEQDDKLIKHKKMEARLTEKDTIYKEWGLYPLITKLFLKQLDLDFENEKVRNDSKSKVEKFADWYKNNKNILLTNEDPLSDAFHREMIHKLLVAMEEVNSLPEGLEVITLDIKKEFISKFFGKFLKAFIVKTQDWNWSTKQERLKECARNILFYAVSDFSSDGKDLKVITDEFSWRCSLLLSDF